jgi:hypothetical protein
MTTEARIYAIEGPAGSGKSTWLRRKRHELSLGDTKYMVLDRPTFPRQHETGMGAWSSSYLEYQAIAAAVMMPDRDYYVDRFLLSRWVYRAIQFNGGELTPNWRREMENSYHQLRTTAIAEANFRIDYNFYRTALVHITLLMPSLNQLMYQRAQASETLRVYPFDAATELRAYGEIFAGLTREPLFGTVIELVKY